jgi:hypothetical protein
MRGRRRRPFWGLRDGRSTPLVPNPGWAMDARRALRRHSATGSQSILDPSPIKRVARTAPRSSSSMSKLTDNTALRVRSGSIRRVQFPSDGELFKRWRLEPSCHTPSATVEDRMVLGKRDYWRLFDEQDGGGSLRALCASAANDGRTPQHCCAASPRSLASAAAISGGCLRHPATTSAHR